MAANWFGKGNMTTAKSCLALAMLAVALGSISVQAVDWDDGGGGTNTWGVTPGGAEVNWTGDTSPTGADDVFINNAAVNGETIDFDGATFRNLTIGASSGGGPNAMGNGLTLEFDTAGGHFGGAGGELRIKSGTGAVSINHLASGAFNLNDSNIVVEQGVTGTFRLGAATSNPRLSLGDPVGNGTVTSTFTNNSDQLFDINLRHSGDLVELTLHSDVNGTPGNFDLGIHSININDFRKLDLTGDAHVDVSFSSGFGSDGGSNVGAPILSTDVGTELTRTGSLLELNIRAADTTIAGKVTGNLSMDVGLGNSAAVTFTNDDTYVGTTEVGSDSSNTQRRIALIREGSHVGGDDYRIIGGMRNNSGTQDAILGGSGRIELQDGSRVILDRDATNAAASKARAILAPGNTGWDDASIDNTTGVAGAISAGGTREVGTLTILANEVLFGDYSRFEVQLDGPNADRLDVLGNVGNNGDLRIASTTGRTELFIDADSFAGANGDSYTLATTEGSLIGTFDDVFLQEDGGVFGLVPDPTTGFLINGFDYQLQYNADSLQLVGPNATTTTVPEPSTLAMWSMLGLGMLLCASSLKRAGN